MIKPLRLSQVKLLEAELKKAMVGATPSLHVSVLLRGEKTLSLKLGEEVTYFDLASLTKVIFTTTRLMQNVDRGNLDVESPVSRYLPWFHYPEITIKQILTHAAGFRWWSPFYKDLDLNLDFHERWMQLQLLLRDEAPDPSAQGAVYSDVDFLFLGLILEAIERKPLLEIWKSYHAEIKGERLHFCVNNTPVYPRSMYAPTENCPWRARVVQGEVHDENTWTLGGVSSHAGLFGRIEDVERWAQVLRDSWLGKGLISHETAQLFLRRSVPPEIGDWALGFMMPSPGRSTSGSLFTPHSVGHTGFTGTSFWWDMERDIMMIVLSNRVHPTRENKSFVDLRPQIHNWIMQQLLAH